MNIETLYEDDDLLIVNKPAGMLVLPDRFDAEIISLHRRLQEKIKQQLWVVHRLDKDTSGIICFAKNEVAHKYMNALFLEHNVGKFYAGLVHGRVMPEMARIDAPIMEHPTQKGKMVTSPRGKLSVTDYRVVNQWPLYALMQFQIHTGRTHQIRVHMQSIGHSLVCDEIYGDGKPFMLSTIKKKYNLAKNELEERPLLSRLALHAYKLEFNKPNGETITVEAPLPKDIMACVNQLNKWCAPQQ